MHVNVAKQRKKRTSHFQALNLEIKEPLKNGNKNKRKINKFIICCDEVRNNKAESKIKLGNFRKNIESCAVGDRMRFAFSIRMIEMLT